MSIDAGNVGIVAAALMDDLVADQEAAGHDQEIGEVMIGTAQHKANALLPAASPVTTDTDEIAEWFDGDTTDATDDDAAGGVKVGTAYIEVRPYFTGFDGDEFERAVERVLARTTPFKGAFSHGAGRAFGP